MISTTSVLQYLFPEEIAAMMPPDKLGRIEWAERFVTLPKDSAIKGKWKASMVPYCKMIFELFQNPFLTDISIVKSAQSGGSVLTQIEVGYSIQQLRIPVMVVLADEDTAEFMSRRRYQPMFEDDEDLAAIRDLQHWTIGRMEFMTGGFLEMAWASSVAKIASRSYGKAISDEIDKRGYNMTTREGPALRLIAHRLETYLGSQHIKLSTPTDEQGNIVQEIQGADFVLDWMARCPFCGQLQPLNFWLDRTQNFWFPEGTYRGKDGLQHPLGCVVWEGGREATNEQILKTSRYQCGECGAIWNTTQKNKAVTDGEAIPDRKITGYERKAGARINRLISKFKGGRLENIVSSYVDIFRIQDRELREEAFHDFRNSSLGEPSKQVIISTTEAQVLAARVDLPPQTVPESAVALVCGIDQQKYGYWFTVVAFAADYTSWLIHYGYLSSEEELDHLLFQSAYPQIGTESKMGIWRAGYDIGGGETENKEITMTERAYLWLVRNRRRGVYIWPTKGSSHAMPGRILKLATRIDKTPSGKPLKRALQLIELNTFDLKAKFHRRLGYAIEANQEGTIIPGAAFLHSGTDAQFASHILAEEKRREKGVEKWVKVRERNDMLDCIAICHALADPEWPGGGVARLRAPIVIQDAPLGMPAVPNQPPVVLQASQIP